MEEPSYSPARSKKQWRHPHHTLTFWLIILIIVCLLAFIRYQRMVIAQQNKNEAALPVVLATAHYEDVPIYLSALGNVTPTYTVTVRTQINGQLLRVLFKEGQMVKAGEVIAEIDPRPYLAQLTQYEGQLIRDQALLANARIDLKRYQTLWKQDSVSEQTLATQIALVKQYEGAIETDKGLIQSIRVNLIYCRIISPINGRIGLRLVDPGNFVQTSDTTGIAVINTLSPITVIFTIPEDNIPQVLPTVYANGSLVVEAYDRQQNKLLATGQLLTLDNQIDPTTGTVKLKATFANKNNALFANQFVNIKLLVKTLKNAIVVPTAAIQYDTKGTFVYLLNDQQRVSVTPVTASVTSGENTVIASGLQSGQHVVTEGADKLKDGAKVRVANNKKTSLQTANHRVYHWRFLL